MATKKNNKGKISAVEQELLEGMQGFLADLKSGESIRDKYTCRRLVLELESQPYSADDVKKTRALLNASQGLFAQLLGVGVKAVQSWESGKSPSDMACRFMDEIQRDPDYWRKRLREAARLKTI